MAKLHYSNSPSEKERKQFQSFLSEDEELVLATGFGKAYLRSLFIIGLVWPGAIGWVLMVGGAYFFGFGLERGLLAGFLSSILIATFVAVHTNHANRYLLTTRRVMVKRGVLAVKLTSALFDKITHLEVDQSLFDKLLYHHGTIIVHTAGAQNDEMILRYVDYPIEFKNLIERLINRQRERYGIRAGAVETVEGEML
ncbi:hypothetical protein A3H85_03720 [Candidatus Daviesbacteria bacterium RIFCSPLOWO2_02_FULL_40_8]|uniref:YdbS-like PH domain-containing protein n=1 Tax=Candidatus Daviesbacteria bacterium RIFCSPLOWO2_01_FULL_40_24 TaxID=1797787 RepID=A0A1F5MK96_9BACT|nr:MAG: hypothetical protein A2780_00795 [Candidatus Daviesbacteria bacterium RIFCSPHIGHO2_01_FULL_41_45]OGE65773.1 MAG: hypothetical protein A3B49_04110 [Candidatus Daviesbacteria bacterium RIFCSPLOWO2_01_FULL_40_24]OGE66508.1 MAG: hypothetical protein A3H85_03720 [Candidatus Daviesbacteria bacterium RIFCSPLOWO2_02_FULL_40_8]